ncbi:MAG: acyl-CoA dehydratase activase [Clostridiaceae bacterium]
MIAYLCKYTPHEIIEAIGEDSFKIEPESASFDIANLKTHNNMCSYVKAALDEIMKNQIKKVVLINCCDSVRRLYDILKKENLDYVYILDLPRKCDKASILIFKEEIKKFIKSLEENLGQTLDYELLRKNLISKNNSPLKNKPSTSPIAIMGARFKEDILNLDKQNDTKNLNLTCTGEYSNKRNYIDNEDILQAYSKSILTSYPCMRMENTEERLEVLNKYKPKGVIYHTIKFCDTYSFEYSNIKEKTKIPVVKIETDYTKQSKGQIKTRLEAFLENIEKDTSLKNKSNKYVMGIDSGSTSTNGVILGQNRNIIAFEVVRTGAKSIESANLVLNNLLKKTCLNRQDIDVIVSTGYGRISIPFADYNVTEISCHGKGAHFVNKNIRTIIDIGGQDSKIIRLNETGDILDFAMNDKCAAGTGRFLEMMARTLDININDMGKESLKWKENLTITSMCTVFAESEVISLIAENKEKADILHALNNSVATRVISLLGRVAKMGDYMLTGGVAKNQGVVSALEEKIGEKIYIYEEPEIIGALGAALIALEK